MEENLPTVEPVTVHVYKKLDAGGFDEGYEVAEGWIKEDLTKKDYVLVPIHRSFHWSFIIIDSKEKTVNYYDSIIGHRKVSNAPRTMKRFIERYYSKNGIAE